MVAEQSRVDLRDLPGMLEHHLSVVEQYITKWHITMPKTLVFWWQDPRLLRGIGPLRPRADAKPRTVTLVSGRKVKSGFYSPHELEPNPEFEKALIPEQRKKESKEHIRESLEKLRENGQADDARKILEAKLAQHCTEEGKLVLESFLEWFEIIKENPSPEVLTQHFRERIKFYLNELKDAYGKRLPTPSEFVYYYRPSSLLLTLDSQDSQERIYCLIHAMAYEIHLLGSLNPELRTEVINRVKQDVGEEFEKIINIAYTLLAREARTAFLFYKNVVLGWWGRYDTVSFSSKAMRDITGVSPTEEVANYIRHRIQECRKAKSEMWPHDGYEKHEKREANLEALARGLGVMFDRNEEAMSM